jgi:DNA polymerase I
MTIWTRVPEQSAVDRMLDEALQAKNVAIDTETNSKDVRDGSGYCSGVSIAYRTANGITAFYMPFWHQYTQQNLRVNDCLPGIQKLLDNVHIINHNSKFDLVSMETLGLDVSRADFYCTMVMGSMLDENQKFRGGFGLDVLSKQWLGETGKAYRPGMKDMIKEDASMLPAEAICEYASVDAKLTLQLFEYELPKLRAEDTLKVWYIKREFTKLLIEMESRGVLLDQSLSRREIERGYDRMMTIKQSLGWRNPASPKDLAIMLLDELKLPEIINTKTGSRTFDKNAMDEYEEMLERLSNPLAQRILEYRGWQKTVTSNYEPYLRLVSRDGRLRCNYQQHRTLTGRLSCELPNLQQIPREGSKPWNGHLKSAFVPKSGYRLIEADFSQLELRLATAYANEGSLIEVFEQGRDIFSEMAEALGQSRQETKTMVYAIQYGAGTRRIANVLGISPQKAKERIDSYYDAYPGFREISNRVQAIVQRHRKVPLWSGRFRHFQWTTEAYKSFNSLIQGGSADIVERVMLRLNKELPEAKILLTVHDSVVFEIPEEQVDAITPEIHRLMEDVNGSTGQDFSVPFHVDIKDWGGK